MELRPHQINALENVNEIFEENNKAIVVHPTGLGKTYIALGLFEQNKDKKLTFVSPSTAILWQLKLKIAREYGVGPEEYKKIFPNLELTTYQQINADVKKSETYIKDFKSEYVVYDEAHHIADNKWGKTAKDIMAEHSEIKFLGLTATPERTDGIDVVKEVFDGNLADEITLEEAVATRLLKMPDYVNAIYSYKPIIEELEERIDALEEIDPEKYIMLKKDMEKAKNALEKADGMPEIFAKHIKEKDGRYIVFCKDIEHLKQMVEASKTQGWFEGVSDKVETLEIHSDEDELTNKKILKRFESDNEATKDTLRVLFSVAKINEGLHLDNLSGVIMLRPTKSKIVFRQQLGRAMSISEDAKQTTAFDIVNNIDSFQDMHDFMEQVIQIRIQNNPDKSPEEIRKEAQEEFNITDETREVSEILRKAAGELEYEWEEFYQRSIKWREEHDGKAPRAVKDDKESTIYRWEKYQKLKYLKSYQEMDEKDIPEQYVEKVKKLKNIGLEYVLNIRLTKEAHFDRWKEWTLTKGKTPNTSAIGEEGKIAQDMSNVIRRMKKEPERYREILAEYEELVAQYGRRKGHKAAEEHFDRWKEWTVAKGKTPNEHGTGEESNIAKNMYKAIQRMKKEPERYREILAEHEELVAQYGARKDYKTVEECFVSWKEWTVAKGITPSRDVMGEEGKIAQDMSNAIQRIKKTGTHREILAEYEELVAQYGRRKGHKAAEEHFVIWKEWTVAKGKTPNEHGTGEESNIAKNMYNAIQRMKKEPERYRKMLDEYKELVEQYGRRKLKGLQKQKQDMISEVRELKGQVEQAEELYNRTQEAIDKVIEDKSKKLEGPGE